MSLIGKISNILKFKGENDCSVSPIDDGWVVNGIPLHRNELQDFITEVFTKSLPEKKRINGLIVLRELGSKVKIFLPLLTKITLTSFYSDKKYVQKFLQIFPFISGEISTYINGVDNHLFVSDLGSLFELNNQTDLALHCWRKAVTLQYDFFFGWTRLSYNYYALGKITEAIEAIWNGVLGCDYDIPSGRIKSKLDLKYKQELETLIDSLQKKEKGENYKLFYIRGLMYYHFQQDYRSAINYFIKTLRLDFSFIEAQYKLAHTFGKVGDKEAQLNTYHRILKDNPSDKKALHHLALYYKEKTDYDLAVSYFETLHNLESENYKWLGELANLYRISSLKVGSRSKKPWDRDLNKAYHYYRQLFSIKKDDPDYVSSYNTLLIELTKHEEAKELLLDFLSVYGNDKTFLRKLEAVYSWLNLRYDESKVLKEINFRRHKDAAYSQILEFLSTVRPSIPVTLPRIAKFVDFPEEKMQNLLMKLLEENPDVGEYLELEQVFIRKENTEGLIHNLRARYSTCYYCGMPFDSIDLLTCSSCQKDILKCSVCKLPISFGEEIGQCNLCETKGHLHHLEEWVKTQGKCPNCLQEIPLQAIEPIREQLKK